MDGVQLCQSYRATRRRQFTLSPGLPGTHLIKLKRTKGQCNNLELLPLILGTIRGRANEIVETISGRDIYLCCLQEVR